MLFSDYARLYAAAHDIRPATAAFYVYAVRSLERDLGRPLCLTDATAAMLNAWLVVQLAAGRNRISLHTTRGAILTLLRAAADEGLMLPLERIRPLKKPRLIVHAWQLCHVRTIVTEASKIRGRTRTGILRGPLYAALFTVAYYSAMRPGDCLARTVGELWPNGLLRWVQEKTGFEHRVVLPADCMTLIRATFPPERERLFPIGRKAMAYHWGKIKRATGVNGSPKWFRRTAATAAEAIEPGTAWKLLGHTGPDLARTNYIDWSQVPSDVRPPPSLLG